MTYDVIIAHRAHEDIADATTWWANHRSFEEAERWSDGIYAALESLSQNPRRFPFANEHHRVELELRQLQYGLGRRTTHRAVFTVDDDSAIVHVLLVHHVARADVDPGELA